jgi:hypothetical protein
MSAYPFLQYRTVEGQRLPYPFPLPVHRDHHTAFQQALWRAGGEFVEAICYGEAVLYMVVARPGIDEVAAYTTWRTLAWKTFAAH